MSFLPASIFLNVDVFSELCTSGTSTGRATLNLASDVYTLGTREINRTLYTLIVTKQEFGSAKEGTVFTIGAIKYKAVKPPVVQQDALVFVCVITP